MTSKITVLLVDDHAVVREGYRSLLGKQPGFTVVAEAADGHEAYAAYKARSPDLVIMDLALPGQGGLATIERIKKRARGAKILVFSMHQNPRYAVQALNAGALGYITKSSPPEYLLKALRVVHAGARILSPDIAEALALEKSGLDESTLKSLSPRESEILRLLAEARSKEEIAEILNLSVKTVSNIHYLIKAKLGLASDIELMHFAIRTRVVDLDELGGAASHDRYP